MIQTIEKSCKICGESFEGVSHDGVNVQLARHGMDEHEKELQRQPSARPDPIWVVDYLTDFQREG